MKFGLYFTLFCAAVLVFAAAYTGIAHAQSIEDGLGGHWTFDKGDTDAKVAKDALGENDGEIKGAPKIVEGIVGDALSFNGKEDYVVMGPATTGQDLTYAMWIKPVALPAGPKVIIWDDDPQGGGDSWLELLADGTIQTQRGGDGFGVFKTKTAVEAGEWTHVTFVAAGKDEKKFLYLNGELDAEADGKINSRDTRSHVVVAVGHDRNAFIKPLYFEGEIDDVAVYHRVLDDKEVMENYQIAFDVEPAGKLALTWGAIKAH
ncbi:MAG: LamG domain-containing protein [Candidatus Poribacteria bacterium]|nr:LamG domain-containing protein [Candidatus Poribacteria bacterium]